MTDEAKEFVNLDCDNSWEDKDVIDERKRIDDNLHDKECPLIVSHMRKVYPNGKLAVKDVTFAVDKNSIFGLLGPNGAGKSTLISILTGLYPQTQGHAKLGGFDLETQQEMVFQNTGTCPQHDILWGDLTVEEHLYFYARLKGISTTDEKIKVKEAIENVKLTAFTTRLSNGLSGGEKRRLSIAIALIGDPKIIFLDEPTTGLDPEVRRVIWDIISKARQGRTVILTTHSMEEAEALCQRIGIMAKGSMKCIGAQARLKQLYGSGFRITFSMEPANHLQATKYVQELLQGEYTVLDDFETMVNYEFKYKTGIVSHLFEEMGKSKEHGIVDWGISQTSLEDVFLKIVNEGDATAYAD